MKTIAALILLGVISTGAHAAGYTIKERTIVCFSEEAHDKQMAMLAQGQERLTEGCGISSRPISVVVLDLNMLSASHVMATENDSELWVSADRLVAQP